LKYKDKLRARRKKEETSILIHQQQPEALQIQKRAKNIMNKSGDR
jgi:hypothetical protein